MAICRHAKRRDWRWSCSRPAIRERLEAVTSDRNRQRKHIERAQLVLASVGGGPVQEIAARVSISRPMVWRWQQRFAEAGVDGLLRDKTRKPGKPPIAAETVARVVALTCADPPHQATHWTGRAMAKAAGISLRSVQRIWAAHNLQPHRVRTFKRSRDPEFAAKLTDIVGLYVDPPAHAVVLSIDEKSQIQALDRTQPPLPIPLASPAEPWAASPGLPIKPGRCGTMTHDYKRHGTTTLFAALNVLDGKVIGRCMQQHRHEEFIRFLNDVERAVPAGKLIEAVVDNYAPSGGCSSGYAAGTLANSAHKHPKVKAWLERHPRWRFHFTPTSGSWLNAVENFFSVLTRKRIRRGSFHSLVDLQAAIKRCLAEHNAEPTPFVWKASAGSILAKLDRMPASSV
jgi:transposase